MRQGSDWFWWFGEGHSSNQDAIFDRLFREHLCGIYKALNEPVPLIYTNQWKPMRYGDHRPQGFIHPVINGLGDEQDWDKAGRLEVGGRGERCTQQCDPALVMGSPELLPAAGLPEQRSTRALHRS